MSIDAALADPANPVVEFEQEQMVDIVALRVDGPPFR